MSPSDQQPDIHPQQGKMLSIAGKFLTHEHSPFRGLNIKPILIAKGATRMAMDLPEKFAGPNGAIDNAAYTIILDTFLGMTIFTALEELMPIATLNLSTEYLRSAPAGARIICSCECIDIVDEVARPRGEIRLEADETLLASSSGAFMVGTRGPAPIKPASAA